MFLFCRELADLLILGLGHGFEVGLLDIVVQAELLVFFHHGGCLHFCFVDACGEVFYFGLEGGEVDEACVFVGVERDGMGEVKEVGDVDPEEEEEDEEEDGGVEAEARHG